MSFSDPERHPEDGIESIDKINGFVGEMEFNAYRSDEKTKAAVERKLQILTEAIIRLEDESPGSYPEIDQKAYRGMGNVLRPSYHRVDDGIVWDTIKKDLPELRELAKNLPARFTEHPDRSQDAD